MGRSALGLAIVFGVSLGASSAFAEEVKIGLIDMQKALQSVDAGKKAKVQLEKEVSDKKKAIQNEQAALQKMDEELRKQSLALSDEARAKKQRDLQERAMRYQEMAMKTQDELQRKEGELTRPIVAKLREIIQVTAKKKGYTLVIEKNENTVFYSQEKDDLTAEIITAYNKGGAPG